MTEPERVPEYAPPSWDPDCQAVRVRGVPSWPGQVRPKRRVTPPPMGR